MKKLMINKIVLCIILIVLLFFSFKYWSIIQLNKSLVSQVVNLVKDRDLCISNKEQLIQVIDKQNKAVMTLKEVIKARGQLIETTKLKNTRLISKLNTKVENAKGSKKIESCDEAMEWLLKEAIDD